MDRDPLLIDEWQTEISPEQRQQYETVNQKWDPVKSLTEAHDRIRQLTKANNKLVERLLTTQCALQAAKTQIWVLTAAVLAEAGAVAWLATQLFSRLH